MLVMVIFAFLSLLVKGQNDDCYTSCKQLSFYDCNICYETCKIDTQSSENDTKKYTFSMKKCTYFFNQRQKTVSSSYQVQKTKTLDFSQHDCIKQCCNNPGYNVFTSQSFNQCVTANQKFSQTALTVAIIFLSAIGGLLLIFVLILFHSICCQALNRSKQSYHSCQIRFKLFTIKQQKLNWTKTQKNLMQLVHDEYCSVCLQKNINCLTSCGHKFHFSCLRSWTIRKTSCPNCKSSQFNDLKIYCQNCTKKQAIYRLKINQNGKIKLFQQPKIICNECNKIKNKLKKIFFENDKTTKQMKLELL